MYKIFLFPKENFLIEYDTGQYTQKLNLIDNEIYNLVSSKTKTVFGQTRAKNFDCNLETLKQQRKTHIQQSKDTVALINYKKEANEYISYYIKNNNLKYKRCEFEIVKIK